MRDVRSPCGCVLWIAVALTACHGTSEPGAPEPAPATPATPNPPPAAAPAATSPADLAFRDAVDAPPPGWTGPVFKLSHDYPGTRPTCDAPWLARKVSFHDPHPSWNAAWQAYVQDIVDYVWDGQDPDLSDGVGWRAAIEGKGTRWYHIPWMAFDGERGREFVHGLTNELAIAESTFRGATGRGTGKHHLPGAAATNGVDPTFETWSIGFYNPCGGFAIGEGWPASGEPAVETRDDRMVAKGMPFPEGTVVVKLLNTTADEHDVPYLKGSTTWQADSHKQDGPSTYAQCARAVRKVHLIQIDLAVVDPRSPTHWVYSTLAYDGTRPGRTVRDRMKPLGVQWGNDHDSYPAVTKPRSKPLRETLLAQLNLPEHYGCNKRLAGVVDQADSSCTSCHMGAFAAAPGVVMTMGGNVPAILTFPTMCTQADAANANYFSDYAYPAKYPGSTGVIAQAIPLDSSLQLQVAFAQYAVFKNPAAPRTCPDPGAPRSPSAPGQ